MTHTHEHHEHRITHLYWGDVEQLIPASGWVIAAICQEPDCGQLHTTPILGWGIHAAHHCPSEDCGGSQSCEHKAEHVHGRAVAPWLIGSANLPRFDVPGSPYTLGITLAWDREKDDETEAMWQLRAADRRRELDELEGR